ncbi:MAG: PIN domain-containing protein [Spirosomataceae bacterium]
MNQFVTDANVIFGCLISGREQYLRLVTEKKFYLPDFALTEIQIYQELITEKSPMIGHKLRDYTLRLFEKLIIVPNFLISTQSYYQAFLLCKDIDEKDTVYVALSLEFGYPLLTRDEELTLGLRQKGFTNIILLKEFFDSV